MNTPKLTSIISSTLGNTGAARQGRPLDPSHGLNFSQLLGERREQAAATTPGPRSDNGAAARRNDSRAESGRQTSQSDTRSAEIASARSADTGTAPSNRREDSRASHESNAATPANTQASPHGNSASAGNGAVQGHHGESRQVAGEQSGGVPSTITTAASKPPAEPAPAQSAELAGAQAGALLAEQAAESGMASLLAEQAAESGIAALLTEQAAESGMAALLVGQVAAPGIEAQADTAALPGSASIVMPEASAASTPGITALTNTQAAVANTVTGTTQLGDGQSITAAPSGGAVADATPATLTTTAALTTAATTARSAGIERHAIAAPLAAAPVEPANTGTAANTLVTSIESTPPPQLNPATLAPAQTATVNAQPSPETPAPAALGIADTAAARSLQDFTAMVAAARATSGTSLQAAAQAQPAFIAASHMPGLAPAGLFGMPTISQGLPGAAGIAAPLHSPQWPTEFGRQFINIAQATNGLGQTAELRLDPPDLGPLRITINLNDNVAHAVFSSPHASVRQTVENALPQLQQMLEQAGISLGQTNVNDQQQPGNPFQSETGNPRRHANAGGGSGSDGNATLTAEERRANRPANPNVLLDTFA